MKIGQVNLSYIGTKYKTPKGGILTVIGESGRRRGKNIIWEVECSICSQDKELFPTPFDGNKFQMDKGQRPCACSPYQYTEDQNKIRLSRVGLIVIAINDKKYYVEDIDNKVCYSGTVAQLMKGYKFEPIIPLSLQVKPEKIESENSSNARFKKCKNDFYRLTKEHGFKVIGKYISAHTPVEMTCKLGHTTSPQPSFLKHKGWSCGVCNLLQEKKKKETFDKAISLGYKIIKRGLRSKIGTEQQSSVQCLTCNHEFKITASRLISKSNSNWHDKCPKCTNKKRKEKFINAATTSGFNVIGAFIDNNSRVKIKCSHGHEISVRPYQFTQRPNCNECNGGGYKTSRHGYLYILRHESESFYKVGISNIPEQRFEQLTRSTPFNFDIIGIYSDADGKKALSAETKMHQMFESANLSGFDGCTEWLIADGSIIDIPPKLGLKY